MVVDDRCSPGMAGRFLVGMENRREEEQSMSGLNWSQEDFTAHMARMERLKRGPALHVAKKETADPGLENDLQGKCIRYCKGKGWQVFHDWSKRCNERGWPDLFIFAEGRVILVELKAAGGRLSDDQRTLRHMLNYLGHPVRVVRSFKRFIEVVEGEDESGNR